MAKLLRIDASARTTDSHSRTLADEVQSQWQAANPGGDVLLRDLARDPIGPIENDTIVGYYTPAEQMTAELRTATAQSDLLIAELMEADALLISSPMYNFSVPAVLKAWIDQVVRIGQTFVFTDDGNLKGVVTGKPAYITTAIGAQFSGTPLESMDFLRPYLKTLLGFIGFEQIEIFSLESTTMDESQFALNKNATMTQIENLFTAQGAALA